MWAWDALLVDASAGIPRAKVLDAPPLSALSSCGGGAKNAGDALLEPSPPPFRVAAAAAAEVNDDGVAGPAASAAAASAAAAAALELPLRRPPRGFSNFAENIA